MVDYPISRNALNWLESLLSERLGNSWEIRRSKYGLKLNPSGADDFILFDTILADLTIASSEIPCSWWNAKHENWVPAISSIIPAPGTSELKNPLVEKNGDVHIIHYDILSLLYWMLARVEEIDRTDLDEHGRFPAKSSHAFKYGYLDRPIVDEWIDILTQVIRRQWPGIKIKKHEFKMHVSCDVDMPFAYDGTFVQIFRGILGDILKRFSLTSAIQNLSARIKFRNGDNCSDPFYCGIKLIMDANEKNGQKVTFFIMSYPTDVQKDKVMSLDCQRMKNLLREIDCRGHIIGIHPGYNTYRDAKAFAKSVEIIKEALASVGIKQKINCSRQHFLRWKTSETEELLEQSRIKYDFTLGYAQRPGFRTGTCFKYQMFNAKKQEKLNLYELPLIVMDCSVLDKKYMGIDDYAASLEIMERLKNYCRKVEGNFTLLWHNSYFKSEEAKKLYNQLIS